MIARVVVLAGFVALATPAIATVATSADYVCSDGTHLTAVFVTPRGKSPIVDIIIGADTRITLPQVKSADGGRYADGDMEFWIVGKDATLTRAGRKQTCQAR